MPLGPGARLAGRLRRDVGDERVLAAVASVPRERFVPAEHRRAAWGNVPLPIGAGQTISQPLVVARMCEALALTGDERVLDVGTGSGYHAALLGRLARHVWSIERHPELSGSAADALRDADVGNVTLLVGDGAKGYPPAAPYDAINVAAATPPGVLPVLEAQLALGGRLVAPLAGLDQRLVLSRRGPEALERVALEHVRFVPLVPDAGPPPPG